MSKKAKTQTKRTEIKVKTKKEVKKAEKDAEKKAAKAQKDAEKAQKKAEEAQTALEALKAKERAKNPRGDDISTTMWETKPTEKNIEEALFKFMFCPCNDEAVKAIMSWAGGLCYRAFRKDNPGRIRRAVDTASVVYLIPASFITELKEGWKEGQTAAAIKAIPVIVKE